LNEIFQNSAISEPQNIQLVNTHFIPFIQSISKENNPVSLNNPFHYTPHPLCLEAAEELQSLVLKQAPFNDYFGDASQGFERGKMFGILVVRSKDKQLGYLKAFSGKLDGKNEHEGFVPPIYDSLDPDGFLSKGMKELKAMSERIDALGNASTSIQLKEERAHFSAQLQDELFEAYHFLNQKKEKKSLKGIFKAANAGYPPTAAGECAAPKLFQYAFENDFEPLAMAEFWWGKSRVGEHFEHGKFYPACEERCRPILGFMLEGII
jgi:tRNA pseudouridine32 synthase/23S rRNA pseudouridine746 synthase